VHAGFIVLVILLMAGLALGMPRDLMTPSRLSRAVLGGMALFWFIRLMVQWFYYDQRIWRGHRFNTIMHFLFTGVWCYLAGAFGFALWQNLRIG
jgi:hypothetical protein